jgi:hypothetical protein
MIDVLHEELIRVEDAPARIPSRPSRATVWRWILHGVRGRQLESTTFQANPVALIQQMAQ